MSGDSFFLDIAWGPDNMPNLPRLVGPFDSEKEAQEWAGLNARRSAWTVQPLAYPYARSVREMEQR